MEKLLKFESLLLFVVVIALGCNAQPSNIDPTNSIFSSEITSSTLMPSVGNGYIATFVGSSAVYIGGLFNGFLNISPSHRAVIPSPLNVQLTLASTSETLLPAGYLFNLKQGTFSEYSSVKSSSNETLAEVEQIFYAHQLYRSLLVYEIRVNNSLNSNDISLNLKSAMNISATADIIFESIPRVAEGVLLFNGSITEPETKIQGQKVVVAMCTSDLSSGKTLTTPAGQTQSFYFLSTFRTNIYGDSQFPANDALSDFNIYQASQTSLFASHVKGWENIWNNVGIEIEGTNVLNLQQVTNTSLYWILSSIRSDWPWGLSPGSLASNGYNGHSFWDTETWMYPGIMMLDSSLGQSLLQYRKNHIAGATRKARTYNPPYKGAMFPWEAGFSGQEVCPQGVDTCRLEQHIGGDICLAAQQYWSATHDLEWLSSTGFPLVYSISEFWASRVIKNGTQYVINNVIPPDEYAVGVNNSVFTNAGVSICFNFTQYAGSLLGISVPSEWSNIAANIRIPFDETLQIYLEYDGYQKSLIKQADVILLGFPLMWNMTTEVYENTLNFYSGVTDPNGPAMTWSMTAIGYLNINDPSTADHYFTRGYANAQKPFQVWTENPDGGAVNFITGCGGFLQSLIFGYPMMRLDTEFLYFKSPSLPPDVTGLTLRMVDYLGNQLNIQVDSTGLIFTLKEANVKNPLYVGLQSPSKYLRPHLTKMSVNPTLLEVNVPLRVELHSQEAFLFTM